MIFTFQKARRCPALVVLAVALLATAVLAASGGDPAARLRDSITRYDPAHAAESKTAAADAFFLFEESKLDRDLATRDPALYRRIEGEWIGLMADMGAGLDPQTVRGRGDRVLSLLGEGARSASAPGSVFFDSALIILREGLEALLIVSALAAYLTRIGHRDKRPILFGGALLAVGGSLLLWIAAHNVIAVSGAGREALEGATMLLAAAVLFWVSYWLISKSEADRWLAFVRRGIERALGRGALFGFALLSFVVVFREGFETVLFYEALAGRAAEIGAGGPALLGGFFCGVALLAVVYVAFARLGGRLPLGVFFSVTGALLYFMAFKFAGAGVHELQAAGWVGATPVALFPDSPALGGWLGLYPYAEPLVAQGVLVLLAMFAMAYMLRQRPRVEAVPSDVGVERRAVGGRR
jgi:high-affinity iron transporter